MPIAVPPTLAASCAKTPQRQRWLERLPEVVQDLTRRWALTLETPFKSGAAWAAPAQRDRGMSAVLKVGMPHFESEHELQGMLFWEGNPTVHVLESDELSGALLLERCIPGSPLSAFPEEQQDVVIARLLQRLWRPVLDPHPFRPLSAMLEFWSNETTAARDHWPDAGLIQEGLQLFQELSSTANSDVLLATDLHAGNVLRAAREPWLVIDPKPFIGDAAFDATQHLFNCPARLRSKPRETIERFADLLGVDPERVRLWMFARAAAEPRDHWDEDTLALARSLC